MKAGWSLIALAAGSLLLGGAPGVRADQHRDGQDWNRQGYRQDQRGRHSDQAPAWNSRGGERGWHSDQTSAWNDRGEQRDGWVEDRGARDDHRGDQAGRWGDRHADNWDRGRVENRRGWHSSEPPFAYVRAADRDRGRR